MEVGYYCHRKCYMMTILFLSYVITKLCEHNPLISHLKKQKSLRLFLFLINVSKARWRMKEKKRTNKRYCSSSCLIVNFNTMPSENHMDKHFVKLVHGWLQEHLTESSIFWICILSLHNYSDCLFEPETMKRIC